VLSVAATARGALAMYSRGVSGTRTLGTRKSGNTGNTRDTGSTRTIETLETLETLEALGINSATGDSALRRNNFSCSRAISETGCRVPIDSKASAPEGLP
jgi:hypothetical protein